MARPVKYTRAEIMNVRRLLMNGLTERDIAKETGISKSTVNRIRNRRDVVEVEGMVE